MALSQLTSCYPLITTPHLAESRDFFVRHFGFEVGFEASWFVWLSRRTSESGTVALAFMSPDHPSRPPGPEAFNNHGLLLTLQVDDARAEEQRLRDGMRGHAQRHRVLAAGDEVGHAHRSGQHQRQRTGPEGLGEAPGLLRQLARPGGEVRPRGQVDDQRMRARPALQCVHAFEARRAARMRPEAVDGLGRERHDAAPAQRGDGGIEVLAG